jgi:enolase
MTKIQHITALEILDSSGNPTVMGKAGDVSRH